MLPFMREKTNLIKVCCKLLGAQLSLYSDYLYAVTFLICRNLNKVHIPFQLQLSEYINSVSDFFGLIFFVSAVYENADVLAVCNALYVDEFIKGFICIKLTDFDKALCGKL